MRCVTAKIGLAADVAKFEFSAIIWRNGPTPLGRGLKKWNARLVPSVDIIGARETCVSGPGSCWFGAKRPPEVVTFYGYFGPFWRHADRFLTSQTA